MRNAPAGTQTKTAMALRYTPPAQLRPKAKKYIKEVVRVLNQRETLDSIDVGALDMLAISYNTYVRANEELLNQPLTIETSQGTSKNPLLGIAKDALNQSVLIMKEFGLTAKSRSNLKSAQEEEEESELEKFVKARQKR